MTRENFDIECEEGLQSMIEAVGRCANGLPPEDIENACRRAMANYIYYTDCYFHPIDFQVVADKVAKGGIESLSIKEHYIYEIEDRINELNAMLPDVVLGHEDSDEWFCRKMELLFLVNIYELSKQRNFAPLPPGQTILGSLRGVS